MVEVESYCQAIAINIISIILMDTPIEINRVDAPCHLIFQGIHDFIDVLAAAAQNFPDRPDKRFNTIVFCLAWMDPNFLKN